MSARRTHRRDGFGLGWIFAGIACFLWAPPLLIVAFLIAVIWKMR